MRKTIIGAVLGAALAIGGAGAASAEIRNDFTPYTTNPSPTDNSLPYSTGERVRIALAECPSGEADQQTYYNWNRFDAGFSINWASAYTIEVCTLPDPGPEVGDIRNVGEPYERIDTRVDCESRQVSASRYVFQDREVYVGNGEWQITTPVALVEENLPIREATEEECPLPPTEPEEPVVEEPVTETPVVEEPVTETPITEEPVVTETPVTETPVNTASVTELAETGPEDVSPITLWLGAGLLGAGATVFAVNAVRSRGSRV